MKIDHEVESGRPQTAREREVVSEPRQAARALQDDDLVEIRMMADHRLRR